MNNFEIDFKTYLQAKIPVLIVATYEWQRLHGFCVKQSKELDYTFYTWSVISGRKKWDDSKKEFLNDDKEATDPIDILRWYMGDENRNSLLLLEDFHIFLHQDQYQIIRLIREVCRLNPETKKTLVIQVPFRVISKELEKEVPILELELPREGVLKDILESCIDELEYDSKPHSDSDKTEIAAASLGMTCMEAEWTYRKIIALKKRLTASEIAFIVSEKEQIIKKEGILEYFHPEGNFNEVGGLDKLKEWLKQRGRAFTHDAKSFGLTSPKGVLLLGIPGCGKSLVAKTIANEWNLPLLKFDLGKVFGGIIGESETNIRKALSLAETISPSILWIDEIEKGLSGLGSNGDSGTSTRVFGTLLTWMQEKKGEVFVIATANNIEQLPPELLRKGRFDEIFFVDLPSKEEREKIFEIHIKKLKRDISSFDIHTLVDKSQGYSGAEIEEAVKEGLFIAYGHNEELSTENIVNALNATYPLSKTMGSIVKNLREWAKVRARLASSAEQEIIKEDNQDPKIPQLKQEKHNPFV